MSPEETNLNELLEKINKLEKRVKELEAMHRIGQLNGNHPQIVVRAYVK